MAPNGMVSVSNLLFRIYRIDIQASTLNTMVSNWLTILSRGQRKRSDISGEFKSPGIGGEFKLRSSDDQRLFTGAVAACMYSMFLV